MWHQLKLFLVRITCELNEICLDVGNDFLSKHGIKQREKLHLNDNTCKGAEIQVITNPRFKLSKKRILMN